MLNNSKVIYRINSNLSTVGCFSSIFCGIDTSHISNCTVSHDFNNNPSLKGSAVIQITYLPNDLIAISMTISIINHEANIQYISQINVSSIGRTVISHSNCEINKTASITNIICPIGSLNNSQIDKRINSNVSAVFTSSIVFRGIDFHIISKRTVGQDFNNNPNTCIGTIIQAADSPCDSTSILIIRTARRSIFKLKFRT